MAPRHPLSDAEIISRSQHDPAAFAEIFERHHDAIARFVRRRLPDSRAEEVVSETFLAALQKLEQFDATFSTAIPWLYGIAVNQMRRHWRAEKRELRAYAQMLAQGSDDEELDESIERADAERGMHAIAEGLAGLSHDDRECLLLSAWTQMTNEQIGFALGIATGTVKSRISRARRKLALQQDEGTTTRGGGSDVSR